MGKSDLAKKAGLSSGYLTHLERGDDESRASNERIQSPKLESIEKIALALEVPVEWLAFGVGDAPEFPAEGAA